MVLAVYFMCNSGQYKIPNTFEFYKVEKGKSCFIYIFPILLPKSLETKYTSYMEDKIICKATQQ